MKILIAALCFIAVPSICSAHSGTLVNAVTSYLPFIAPIVAGIVASWKNFFGTFTARFKNFFKKSDNQ